MFKQHSFLRMKPNRYELVNPKEPNLYRELFPYETIPRLAFDDLAVPVSPPKDIWITDTTFRDGQQARAPYSPGQIGRLYGLLHRLGGDQGMVRTCEFFLYTAKDREAVEICRAQGRKYPQITGWIRADAKDLEIVKQMELEETGILTSASDYHIYLKLGLDRAKAMEHYLDIVGRALEAGIRPRCHIEDATRADFYGFVVPFAQRLMDLSEEADTPIKIRICDTLGYGVPFPEVALPRSVPKLIYGLVHEAGVPGECLEWHGHNDFHKVLVNATAAWLHGCSAVNATLLGLGERTGNAPLEAALIELISLTGDPRGADVSVITEIAEYFTLELGYPIPPNYPFVGREFNTTRAGIHADGAAKNPEIYNIFDTEKILGRPPLMSITDKSGVAGIAHWVNLHLKLDGESKIDKRHPGVARIFKLVQKEYERGRNTEMSTDEMEHLAKKHLPELFVSELERLKRKAGDMAAHIVEHYMDLAEIKTMDPKRMEPVLEKMIEENPFIQYAYAVNTVGEKITRNVFHPEDRSAYEQFTEHSFSDRDWFKAPIRDGKIYVSDFYTSRVTKKLCITVSGLIQSAAADVLGVLGADIMFEQLVKAEEEEG